MPRIDCFAHSSQTRMTTCSLIGNTCSWVFSFYEYLLRRPTFFTGFANSVFWIMFLNRKQEREVKLSKRSLIELEDELWRLNQLTKLNKDTRNRKLRLEKVVSVKRLALQAVQEKIAREVEKNMSNKLPEVTGK